jgi:hypothetical protein
MSRASVTITGLSNDFFIIELLSENGDVKTAIFMPTGQCQVAY